MIARMSHKCLPKPNTMTLDMSVALHYSGQGVTYSGTSWHYGRLSKAFRNCQYLYRTVFQGDLPPQEGT